jgi:two-component system, NtrC family, response regulator AtoC
MTRGDIVVVDDEQSIRQYLSDLLQTCGFSVESFESGEDVLARLAAGAMPDLMLLDVMIPGIAGLEVLERAKKTNPALPVIMLSAVDQARTVVDAMRMGAADYLTKPFLDHELEQAVESALEKKRLQDEVRVLRRQLEDYRSSDIISTSPRIVRLRETARSVADVDVPVLILGESGVGKEVFARFVHNQSRRHANPFVKINCAALPHDLLESELFGYERGAFTGAQSDKPGQFELAQTGTILLDEIGEMSAPLQAKLLHVLQDGEFTRLGGRRPLRTDARILAATNRNLEKAVARREFRADLYFRLNVIKLEIPPLRARKEDIPLFCTHFLNKYQELYHSRVDHFPRDLMKAFAEYGWPGNVRELENVVRRYLILGDLEAILADLRESADPGPASAQEASAPLPLKAVAATAAEQAEKNAVLRALESTNWNRKKAAQELGICYKALLNKLKKWQLDNRTFAVRPRDLDPIQ